MRGGRRSNAPLPLGPGDGVAPIRAIPRPPTSPGSLPAAKQAEAVEVPASGLALPSCAFMGTVVLDGSGLGVVTGTSGRTAFGTIAMRLGER